MKRGWLSLLAFAACTVTESGNPPVLDLDRIGASDAGGIDIQILGAPGAVSPAEGVVSLVNLESGAREESPVAADGSFDVAVDGGPGDELRLEAVAEERSAPYDFVVSDDGLLVPSTRALEGCFVLEPSASLTVPAGEAAEVLVQNRCPMELQLVAPRWIEPGFAADPSTGFSVPEGGTATVRIAHLGPEEVAVLLLTVTSPEGDRRPITVETR